MADGMGEFTRALSVQRRGMGEFTRALWAQRQAGKSTHPSAFPVNAGMQPTAPNFTGLALMGSALGSLGSTIASVVAAKQQQEAAQAAARYNAALAEIEGRAEEMRQRRIGRRALSSQFVQMAGKSGVIAEEGGWLEALTWNAAEYEANAVNAGIAGRNRAALEKSRARVAGDVGSQQSAAAILSGANRLAGMGLSLASGGSYPTVAYTPGTSGSAR